MTRVALFTWLFTCFVGTLILSVVSGLMEHNIKSSEISIIALLALGITLLASIPAIIIYNLLAQTLQAKMNLERAKIICSLYAIVATALSCIIVLACLGVGLRSDTGIFLLFASPYAISFVIGVWIFHWPAVDHPYDDAVPTKEDEAVYQSGFPTTPYYIVTGIGALVVLYSTSQLILNGIRGNAILASVVHMLDIGLMVTGLILFMQKRNVGWKLLVLLFCSGITGSVISFLFSASTMLRHIGQLYGYYANMIIFLALDATALIMLGKPLLRSHYDATPEYYKSWILAGIGYAILRMAMFRLLLFP